jgi:hypothetical protein
VVKTKIYQQKLNQDSLLILCKLFESCNVLGLCNLCFDVLFYSCYDWETLAWMTVVKINGDRNYLQWKRFDELIWQTLYFECVVSWCFVLLIILGNCLLQ